MLNDIILMAMAKPKEFIHVLLSTLAFGVLCIAALQATILAVQEYLLRHKLGLKVIQIFPPLEAMEVFLFRIIISGFVLLTLVVLTSILLFQQELIIFFWKKTLLSLFAWLVFLMLLMGRYYFGWRGRVAIRWTFSGVFLVILAYFGTTFF